MLLNVTKKNLPLECVKSDKHRNSFLLFHEMNNLYFFSYLKALDNVRLLKTHDMIIGRAHRSIFDSLMLSDIFRQQIEILQSK